MDLSVPNFVVKVDLHDAISIAPANAYIKNPVLFTGVTEDFDPMRFENGGIIMSMEDYLSDGLHFKDASYKIMFELVTGCIRKRWPEILPENMSMPVAWWGDIAARNQRDEL